MVTLTTREDWAVERSQLDRPEVVLKRFSTALDAIRREHRDPSKDPALALLARQLTALTAQGSETELEQACRLRLRSRRTASPIKVIFESPIGGDPERKAAFKTEAVKLLKQLATALGYASPRDYDLWFNPGGPAVSGEAVLHSDELYVQVGEGFLGPVLYRSCKGRKDYRGDLNHFASLDQLADPHRLASTIRRSVVLRPRDTGLLL